MPHKTLDPISEQQKQQARHGAPASLFHFILQSELDKRASPDAPEQKLKVNYYFKSLIANSRRGWLNFN